MKTFTLFEQCRLTWKTSNLHVLAPDECSKSVKSQFAEWTGEVSGVLDSSVEVKLNFRRVFCWSVEKLNRGETSSGYEMFLFSVGGTFWTSTALMGVFNLWAGLNEHSTWTVPDKHESGVSAPSREHSSGSASQNTRSRTKWIRPIYIYYTHYFFKRLFTFLAWTVTCHRHVTQKKYMHIASRKE